MNDNAVQAAVGRLAAAQRHKHTPEQIAEARNNLLASKAERAITEALNPPRPYAPLRQADRTRLAQLLLGDDWHLQPEKGKTK
jgi:hypothetical protein